MSRFTGNWVDTIAHIIPGYRGYKDMQMRRDTDRLVRNAIAKLLTDRKSALDRAIADLTKAGKLDALDKLGQIKRKIDNAALKIQHAPAGYSGWFDTVQVKAEDLERLYQFDQNLHAKATEAAGLVDPAALAKDPAGAAGTILSTLEEFERLVGQRDQVITEVR